MQKIKHNEGTNDDNGQSNSAIRGIAANWGFRLPNLPSLGETEDPVNTLLLTWMSVDVVVETGTDRSRSRRAPLARLATVESSTAPTTFVTVRIHAGSKTVPQTYLRPWLHVK